MTDVFIEKQERPRPARPLGVWILTIYALVFAGLAPLLLSLFVVVSGNGDPSLLLSAPISIGVIVSAVRAWQGKEGGRRALLIFVLLHYVLVGINNFLMINSGQVPTEEQTRLWGRVLRGFLYPAFYFWYFNRDTTREFYKG
jgi:hypothetical protein